MELIVKIVNKGSYLRILFALILFLSGTVYGQTGFFESLGISSTKGSQSSYKKVIKPSSNATTDLSEKSTKLSKNTVNSTYNKSVLPSVESSVEFSEKTGRFTLNSSENSVEFSIDYSIKPTSNFSTKGSTFFSEITSDSIDLTDKTIKFTRDFNEDYIIPSILVSGLASSALYRKSWRISDYSRIAYLSNGNITAASKGSYNLSHRYFQSVSYDILYPSFKSMTDISSVSSGLFMAGLLFTGDKVIKPSYEVSSRFFTGTFRFSENSYNSLIEESILNMIGAGIDLSSAAFGKAFDSATFLYGNILDLADLILDLSIYATRATYYSSEFLVKELLIDSTKALVDLSYATSGITLNTTLFTYEESLVDLTKAAVDISSFTAGLSLNTVQFTYEELVDVSKTMVDISAFAVGISAVSIEFIVLDSSVDLTKKGIDLSYVTSGATRNSTIFVYDESVVDSVKMAVDVSSVAAGLSFNALQLSYEELVDVTKTSVDISYVAAGITANSSGITYDGSSDFLDNSFEFSLASAGFTILGSKYLMDESLYPSIEISMEAVSASSASIYNATYGSVNEIIVPGIENTLDLFKYITTISGYAFVFVFEKAIYEPLKFITLNTLEFSDNSSRFTGDFTKNTLINTARVTGDKIEVTSKETTKGTEKSYDFSSVKSQKISKSSVDSSGKSGKNSLKISREMDISLAKTSEKTSFWRTPREISPIAADKLISDSYAGKGEVLSYFAQKLNIKEDKLAELVKSNVPKSPTLDELRDVLSYVFRGLEKS